MRAVRRSFSGLVGRASIVAGHVLHGKASTMGCEERRVPPTPTDALFQTQDVLCDGSRHQERAIRVVADDAGGI